MTTTTGITAIVPINALPGAKSRLRPILGDCDRQGLVLWMAARVLAAIRDSGAADGLAVVSPDPRVLRWARQRGAAAIEQRGGALNDGLELGRRWALEHGSRSLLVLFGDLPLLTAHEVAALIQLSDDTDDTDECSVVLAPDRPQRGTNGMLLRPPAALPFQFGAGSLEKHRAAALAAGVEPALFVSTGTSFDVDTPADVEALVSRGLWRPWDGPLAAARREEGA